ncbi:hypothetical protein EV1_003057 [Malus domestica]
MPLVFFSVIPLALHVLVAYGLIHWTTLGFRGALIAASISIWISMLMLATYVKRAKKFERTWEGFSFESFHYVLMDLKLALPFATMVCLEYWAFEILVFLAGVMPNAKQITSLIAMCVNTEAIAYMITYGLSAAASTRVSNELGAGNPEKAKKAMVVTLKLSVLLAFLVDLALAVGHNLWAGLFSDSRAIIKLFAYMTPFLAISVLADSVQGVLSSVARGCGVAALGCVRKLEHVLFDQDDNCRWLVARFNLWRLLSSRPTFVGYAAQKVDSIGFSPYCMGSFWSEQSHQAKVLSNTIWPNYSTSFVG